MYLKNKSPWLVRTAVLICLAAVLLSAFSACGNKKMGVRSRLFTEGYVCEIMWRTADDGEYNALLEVGAREAKGRSVKMTMSAPECLVGTVLTYENDGGDGRLRLFFGDMELSHAAAEQYFSVADLLIPNESFKYCGKVSDGEIYEDMSGAEWKFTPDGIPSGVCSGDISVVVKWFEITA